jgi:hypothetical protein
MIFMAEGMENGAPYTMRMSFIPASDGSVRQLIERSNDHGATWHSEYDLTYRHVSTTPN